MEPISQDLVELESLNAELRAENAELHTRLAAANKLNDELKRVIEKVIAAGGKRLGELEAKLQEIRARRRRAGRRRKSDDQLADRTLRDRQAEDRAKAEAAARKARAVSDVRVCRKRDLIQIDLILGEDESGGN